MTLSVRAAKRFPAAIDSAGFQLDIVFEAAPGVTVLFGASGAGKSLTLDCVAGFTKPDTGRIILDNAILFDAATNVNIRLQDRECGYVFQNHALFPHMTLRENLEFAAERRPRLERHRRVAEMIERFQLGDLAGRRPREVSGGQRQRCSIARALIATPKILLLDEPARGMDAALREDFHALVRELKRDLEIPLLLVTHDLDEAMALGGAMLVYEAGKIVQAGSPQAVLARPSSAHIASLFGHINILAAEILALDPGRNTSRLRLLGSELAGPYFPGFFLRDHITVSIRADDVRVHNGAGENRLQRALEAAIEHAHYTELRFNGGIAALAPRRECEPFRDARDWYIELPAACIRLMGAAIS